MAKPGRRAGNWGLSKGYPALAAVHGIQSDRGHILYGKLTQPATVIGAPISGIPATSGGTPGSGLVTVYVAGGAGLLPSDPPMTFTGYNFSKSAIEAGQLAAFVKTEGLWTCGGGSETKLVRFELTADLVYATDPSDPNAVILTYHDGAYHADGDAISVFDWTNDGSHGTWSGKGPATDVSGYQGLALYHADRDVYEIVWMEQQAQFISFRLYQRLKTSDASQTACAVLYFWNGRDPDPASAGVEVVNMPTDYAGIYKFSGDANAMGYAIWNEKLGQYQIVAIEGDGRHWVLVKNNSGSTTIPANSCVAVLDVIRDAGGHTNKRDVCKVDRPDTTLRRNYLITGYSAIAAGSVGVAFGFDGPMEAAVDSGTPANGETWGPKPGQYTLHKGNPGFLVDGDNGDDSVAVVRFEAITELLVQATAGASAGSSTAYYKVMTGTLGSETDGGWTSVPAARVRYEPILNTAWCRLILTTNGWDIEPLPAQHKARVISGTLAAALTPGGSCSCNMAHARDGLSPGSTVTVYSDESIFSGVSGAYYKAYYDLATDKYYFTWVQCDDSSVIV